jgi:hypothetical protein
MQVAAKVKQALLNWIKVHLIAIGFSLSASYSLITHFTDFFLAPRDEKVQLFIVVLSLAALLFFLLPKKMFKPALFRSHIKVGFFAILSAISILIFLVPPPRTPTLHELIIKPDFEAGSRQLTIESIDMIGIPDGGFTPVFALQVEFVGNGWQSSEDQRTINWTGTSPSYLEFSRVMASGVKIRLMTGPQQGSVKILWDGTEQTVDLNEPVLGSHVIELKPLFDFARLSNPQKLIVGLAFFADLFSLSLLVFFSLLTPRIIRTKYSKLVFLSFLVLLILIPIIAFFDPVVSFGDKNVEEKIRDTIGLADGEIRRHHLMTIVKLDLSESSIKDLTGIENLRHIKHLDLRDNNITSIEILGELRRLQKLNLRGNQVTDIAPLRDMVMLEYLNLRDNPVTDLSPIAGLTELRDLNISGIPLTSGLGILKDMKYLENLNIRNCDITDLSPLVTLMENGALQDDPISGKTTEIDIRYNPIPLSPMDGYAALRPFWDNISLRAPFLLPVGDIKQSPHFSHSGGFYPQEFFLELSVTDPEAIIYYTTDGSQPSISTQRYVQPVRIQIPDPGSIQTQITQANARFQHDPIKQMLRAAIVRAAAFYPDGTYSQTITHTFFIDHDSLNKYTLPVVSISIDPVYLFDEVVGIYTTGVRGEEFGDLHANFRQRGAEWERPIHIEFFDTERDVFLSQNAGIRIHGAATRGYPQKSLRLYADSTNRNITFSSPYLFPDLRNAVIADPMADFYTLLLRNSGNIWNYFFFRDTLMQSLVDPNVLDIQASRPVIVFLNGDYWGIYDLRERIDAEYLATHYNITPEEIVILERNAQINHGQHGDQFAYQEMLDYIRNHFISEDNHFEYISSLMDIQNFIDYQIAEIYSRNNNWPHDNIKYWRYKPDTYEPYAPAGRDGKWRWLLFDIDTGFGLIGGEQAYKDNTLREAEGEFLFRSLLENQSFRTQFINRFADQLNTFYSSQRVLGILQNMQSELEPEMQDHLDKWNILNSSLAEWKESLGVLYTFAAERPTYVRQHIADRFDINGTHQLTVTNDFEKGYVRINTIDILPTTPGIDDSLEWTGIYFDGIPISITAIPRQGYVFTGWEGINADDERVILSLESDLVITAKFEKAE